MSSYLPPKAVLSSPLDPNPKKLVEVLKGRVSIGGQSVTLSRRELQLVVALALRGPSEAESLAEDLWPSADGDSAKLGLKVYVHRVRCRVGRDFIVHKEGRYCLCDAVHVDLFDLEDQLSADATLDDECTTAESNLDAARQLRRIRWPSKLEGQAWLAAHAVRLAERGRAVAVQAARRAVECARFDRALLILKDILEDDACDEEAQELVVRVHLSRGEQGAAVREYRRYAAMLMSELNAKPSKSLQKMFVEAS